MHLILYKDMILLYQLTLELLLYLIHDNVDFTLFYCVRLKLDSRFNWGINNMTIKKPTRSNPTSGKKIETMGGFDR